MSGPASSRENTRFVKFSLSDRHSNPASYAFTLFSRLNLLSIMRDLKIFEKCWHVSQPRINLIQENSCCHFFPLGERESSLNK